MRHLLSNYLTCVLIFGAFVPIALAQKKVDARMTHERVWAELPLVGTGTITDPS